MSTEIIVAQPSITLDLTPYIQAADQLTAGIASLTMQANALKVTDDDSYQQCRALLTNAKDRIKGLEKLWKSVKDPLNAKRQEALDLEKRTTLDAKKIAELLESKAAGFIRAQTEAKRKIEQELAREAAARQKALQVEAEDLLSLGFVAEANQAAMHAQVASQLPILPPVVEKGKGLGFSTPLKGVVTDPISVITAIAKGKIPLMYDVRGTMRPLVTIDPVVVNSLVSRMQRDLDIPGIVVEEDISFRG